ncbi:hypothetical protein M406DRAFT_97783 [Cryphonectria parasitica EP155]|uniref:CFEM domain-containing protein n=1 Tax=Cryphonectria parasitica (strain ATCC 38755 / EP155) TaxID=660469 RepID=A0A9P4Y558_CRYP1|nr:uncharacterized protein M406DRAFT_97783 [Cryphonectria parasitica EP155]KAF3767154.1 hypothetical protein M406DRAFT_97783 [Cryphonectria parasitica EP155]
MQLSFFSAALFAGLSFAQFSGLPTCAQDCASDQFSGGSYAGCGTDPKCICSNQDFLSNIACCLVGACDAADQTSAIAFATQICSAQGVTVPTVVSCATAANTQGTAAATATETTGSAATASSTSGTAASSSATSGSAAQAWAPRQTAAMGMEMLGLAAAGAGIALM